MLAVRNTLAYLACVVVAFFLQLVIAPYIAIGHAMPNFVVAVVLAGSVAGRNLPNVVVGFFAGMLYAFVCGGPVGALAAVLIVCAVLGELGVGALQTDGVLMPIVLLLATAFLAYTAMAFVNAAAGLSTSLADSFVYIALPCTLYTWIASIVAFIAMRAVTKEQAPIVNLDTPSFR